MDADLHLTCDDLADEALQHFTQDACRLINDETEIRAQLPEATPQPGTRGDPITIGTIVLAAFTSGAVVAFMKALRVLFERRSRLNVELKRKDGATLLIDHEQLKDERVQETIRLARDFFELG